MTARLAMGVFELAGLEARKRNDAVFGSSTFAAAAEHVMSALAAEPPTLPRLDP